MVRNRFNALQAILKSPVSDVDARNIANEALSMTASVVARFCPDGCTTVKRFHTSPGNVPELLEEINLVGLRSRREAAQAVDVSRLDALAKLTDLHADMVSSLPAYTYPEEQRNRFLGPSPDDFVAAARQGLPFDAVRERMIDQGHRR